MENNKTYQEIMSQKILSNYNNGSLEKSNSDELIKSNLVDESESKTLDVLKSEFVDEQKKSILEKSYDILSNDIILKSQTFSKKNLVAKKVEITHSDGSKTTAIRWVDPNKGNKAFHHPGHTKEDDFEGKDEHEKVSNIVNRTSGSKKQKTKDLVSMGIYDTKHLGKLADKNYGRDFLKEADINYKEFSGYDFDEKSGEVIFNDPSFGGGNAGGKGYKPEIDVEMSMEIAKDLLTSKDFDRFQKKEAQKIKEEFGITSDKMWLSYERSISRIIQTGQPKSLLAFGTGGVGKTYTFEQVIKANDLEDRVYKSGMDLDADQYDVIKITGSITKNGLWRRLYENRDKLVVFDDCDSMWDDPDLMNWLKGALDSTGDGTITNENGDKVKLSAINPDTGESERAPREFQFTGQVIFISNLTRADLVKKGAGPIVESRSLAVDLTMTTEQTMDKLKKIKDKIIIKDKHGNAINVNQTERDMAFDFLDKFKDKISTTKINGRTLGNLMGTATNLRKLGQLTPENFMDEALILTLA